jgi:hypothetical protein
LKQLLGGTGGHDEVFGDDNEEREETLKERDKAHDQCPK